MEILRYIRLPKLLSALVVCLLMGTLCSCEEVIGSAEEFKVKEKTLLVYMIANNNLSSNAISNLSAIRNGYLPDEDKGNIVVYYHVPNQNPLLLNVLKEKSGKALIDTVYRFPSRNSATKESLKSAMNVTATLFPSNEYGLILWSHGTGWLPVGYYENPVGESTSANAPALENGTYTQSGRTNETDPYAHMIKMATDGQSGAPVRSFGSDSGKEMELKDIVAGLPYKLSFIIFDACLMGGVEVAYELKDSTDYLLFSPAEILASGFPYSKIMEHIFATPTDLESVAKEYYNFYNEQPATSRYATISLVKTSELEKVAEVAKEVFSANREKISSLDVSSVQRYYRGSKHWFYDLGDFIEKIATPQQLQSFVEALDDAVLYKATTQNFFDIVMTKYSGLSTYIPNPADKVLAEYYRTLKWNEACEMIKEDDPVESPS